MKDYQVKSCVKGLELLSTSLKLLGSFKVLLNALWYQVLSCTK